MENQKKTSWILNGTLRDDNPSAARALIDLDNFHFNLSQARRLAGPEKAICMVVKANAYGHGIAAMSQAAEAAGVDALGIVFFSEARAIREAGVKLQVLLMSSPLEDEVAGIVTYDVEPFVGGMTILEKLAAEGERQGKVVRVHLEVDTGMSRNGCEPDEAPELAAFIDKSPYLHFAGLCTHFACCGEAEDYFFDVQKEKLFAARDGILARGLHYDRLHAANSGALIGRPELHFDMLRLGLLLYGYYPARDLEKLIEVRPIMTLETRVIALRRVEAGTPVSYSMTYKPERAAWIATLRIGYGDGIPRTLSGKARVVIRGRSFPLVGRVCMDHVMIDLGPETDVTVGDRAVFFGCGKGIPTADDVADLAGTINYEILTGVGGRVSWEYISAEWDR